MTSAPLPLPPPRDRGLLVGLSVMVRDHTVLPAIRSFSTRKGIATPICIKTAILRNLESRMSALGLELPKPSARKSGITSKLQVISPTGLARSTTHRLQKYQG